MSSMARALGRIKCKKSLCPRPPITVSQFHSFFDFTGTKSTSSQLKVLQNNTSQRRLPRMNRHKNSNQRRQEQSKDAMNTRQDRICSFSFSLFPLSFSFQDIPRRYSPKIFQFLLFFFFFVKNVIYRVFSTCPQSEQYKCIYTKNQQNKLNTWFCNGRAVRTGADRRLR